MAAWATRQNGLRDGGAGAGRSDQDWDRAPFGAGVVVAPQLWAGIVVFVCGDASQPKGFGRWGALAYYAVFGAWSSCFVARTLRCRETIERSML